MNQTQISEKLVAELESCELHCWKDIYSALSSQVAWECGIRHFSINGALAAMASNIDALMLNRLFGTGLNTLLHGDMIDTVMRRFSDAAVKRFFFQLDPIVAAGNLPGILLSKGFRHYNNWMRLYRETGRPFPVVTNDLRIERIDSDFAADFSTIVTTEFHIPAILRPWFSALVDRPNWHHYLAFAGNTPAATASLFVDGEQGWIGFAATREEYRNKGAQGALVARRIRDAAELGCRRLVVETAEDTPERDAPSFRNMLRFGFELAYKKANYIFPAA